MQSASLREAGIYWLYFNQGRYLQLCAGFSYDRHTSQVGTDHHLAMRGAFQPKPQLINKSGIRDFEYEPVSPHIHNQPLKLNQKNILKLLFNKYKAISVNVDIEIGTVIIM